MRHQQEGEKGEETHSSRPEAHLAAKRLEERAQNGNPETEVVGRL